MRKRSFTLNQLREKLAEVLLAGDRPVMVTKNGMPLGFFVPVRLWKAQEDSVLARHLVELILTSAGQALEDVQKAIDDAGPRKRRYFEPRRMPLNIPT